MAWSPTGVAMLVPPDAAQEEPLHRNEPLPVDSRTIGSQQTTDHHLADHKSGTAAQAHQFRVGAFVQQEPLHLHWPLSASRCHQHAVCPSVASTASCRPLKSGRPSTTSSLWASPTRGIPMSKSRTMTLVRTRPPASRTGHNTLNGEPTLPQKPSPCASCSDGDAAREQCGKDEVHCVRMLVGVADNAIPPIGPA